jgi:hypothetical protein
VVEGPFSKKFVLLFSLDGSGGVKKAKVKKGIKGGREQISGCVRRSKSRRVVWGKTTRKSFSSSRFRSSCFSCVGVVKRYATLLKISCSSKKCSRGCCWCCSPLSLSRFHSSFLIGKKFLGEEKFSKKKVGEYFTFLFLISHLSVVYACVARALSHRFFSVFSFQKRLSEKKNFLKEKNFAREKV